MKKVQYVFGLFFLVITLIPQVTFASWWNPFSWFKKEPKTEQTTTVVSGSGISTGTQEPKTTPVSANGKKKTTTSDTQKKSIQKEVTSVVATPPPPVYDVCENISGVQATAPAGMYADNGKCTFSSTTNNIKQQTTAPESLPPVVKTDQQICEDKFGSNSLYSGQKNTNGGLICACKSGYEWNNNQTSCQVSNQYQTPTQQYTQDQAKTNQIQALTQEYDGKVSAINQQIIDIKTQYYIDLKRIDETAGFVVQANGLKQKLLNDDNAKIDQLNLQIQQLYLDYTNKINQLN